MLAPAKVNLLLRVQRPARPDGYHNIESVLQTIDLADTVSVSISRILGVTIACDDPTVPCDATNLAVRAARLFLAHADSPLVGVAISIRKAIPAGAGLGGGSSDAAATLVALRTLLAPEMPDSLLESLAADIGSDVPFFVRGGTQVALGRGEVLTGVGNPVRNLALVVAKPEASCSTAEVYARYDRGAGERSAKTLRSALADIASGRVTEAIANDLSEAAQAVAPEITRVLRALADAGLSSPCVTGSGSACFAVARDLDHARCAARDLHSSIPFVRACAARESGCEVIRGD